jgi:hypothetical protein
MINLPIIVCIIHKVVDRIHSRTRTRLFQQATVSMRMQFEADNASCIIWHLHLVQWDTQRLVRSHPEYRRLRHHHHRSHSVTIFERSNDKGKHYTYLYGSIKLDKSQQHTLNV